EYKEGECIRYQWGQCTQYSQPGYEDVPIQSGTVTLSVKAVLGNAGNIASSNNNISSRALGSTSAQIVVPAATSSFKAVHQIDVTELVREAMSDSSWQLNGAVMFVVSTPDGND